MIIKIVGVFIAALTVLPESFAVIGDYLPASELPESTCLLSIYRKPSPESLDGHYICSGTLISPTQVMTANHCLAHEDLIAVNVHCGNKMVGMKSKKLTNRIDDVAVITTVKPIEGIRPMPIANKGLLALLENNKIKEISPFNCAIFGYGQNNERANGILHGVYSGASEISWVRAFQNSLNFLGELKELRQRYRKSGEAVKEKMVSLLIEIESISLVYNAETKESLKDDILLKHGVPKLVLESYYRLVSEGLVLQRRIGYERFKKDHPNSTYIKTYSFNHENNYGNAGISYGDSGGTFACKVKLDMDQAPQWVLFGVNSYQITTYTNVSQTTGAAFYRWVGLFGFASLLTPPKLASLGVSEVVKIDSPEDQLIEQTSYWQVVPKILEMPQDVLQPAIVYKLPMR